MSASLADFAFEIVNVALLAAALGWFLWKPVRNALDAERARRARDQAEVDARRADAERMAAEAAAARAALASEGEHERERHVAAARAEATALMDEARRRAADQRRATVAELDALRLAHADQLAESVGAVAGRAVRELLGRIDAPALDDALIRAAGERLRELPPGRAVIAIDTARPLLDAQRRSLSEAVGIDVHERVVAELGAGVRITTTTGQIDATAAGIAREAAHQVAHAVSEEVDHA